VGTSDVGPLELLVIQPTVLQPRCHYCYLPDRQNKKRISTATLDACSPASRETGARLTVARHAGEPLVRVPGVLSRGR
jgi:sulfatase maturation enzyme AslB (radical SAM superfamily)